MLLREVTFNAELNQLVFTPLPELASLRKATPLLILTPKLLQPSQPLFITSNQSSVEVIVDFEIPSTPTSFGVSVGGLSFYVNYTARNTSVLYHEVAIGMSPAAGQATQKNAQQRWRTQREQQLTPLEIRMQPCHRACWHCPTTSARMQPPHQATQKDAIQ